MASVKGNLKIINRVATTPLLHLNGVKNFRNLFVKDESVHYNGTFKDALVGERYPQDTTFGVISYGNTAISLTQFINKPGSTNQVIIFVPEGFEDWTFGPSSLGTIVSAKDILKELRLHAKVVPIELSSKVLTDDDLFNLAKDYGLSTKNFVNITEGLDVPAYVDIVIELVKQLGQAPDVCIVPYGAGILCNEVKDHVCRIGHGMVIPIAVASPNSLAFMLYGPVWVDTYELKRAGVAFSRHKSPDRTGAQRQPYQVFLVSEKEILDGLRIAKDYGISAEPSGVAGLGILNRLCTIHPSIDPYHDLIVIINTGNGIDGFLRRLF